MNSAAPAVEAALLQYGPLGVFAVVLVVFARTAYRDLQAAYKDQQTRADRLEARNSALNDSLQDKVIPALVATGEALREAVALHAEMRRERETLLSQLQAQQRQRGE